MKKLILIILILTFLQSCGSVTEGFKLKKGNTGDEFLVEKKNPLVLPPNFNDLPEPGKKETTDQNNNETFEEKILNNALKDNNEKEKTNRTYNSHIEIAQNSGHLPHLEEPKLVAEAWRKFKK